MSQLLQDVRYAVRALATTPGVAVLAVLTLGVAIGANTAMFSAFYAVLLKPLPYAEPERLYLVWEDASVVGFPKNSPAPANYFDWRAASARFADMAAVSSDSFNLTGLGEPEQLDGATVTANLLDVLGAAPALGRGFADGEDDAAAERVVLLSHGLWQRRFGGDPGVVGRRLTLDGRPVTVVGVMPPAFAFPAVDTQLWTPFAWDARRRGNREDHYLLVVGRLAADASAAAAQAELAAIGARLAAAYPDTNTNLGCLIEPLRELYSGDVRPALLVLMGAVGLVLLVACTNVASLMLARAARRSAELRVRAALGAAPGRLVRLVASESLLLALAGTALGIGLAAASIRALATLLPAELPEASRIQIDLPVLAFACGLALLTTLLFGLLPAWQASRLELAPGLRQAGRGVAGGGSRLRAPLVVGQLALSLCLLIGAGLMLRTLVALTRAPLGFEPGRALLVRTPLAGERYRPHEARVRFFQGVLEKVRAQPGVTAAGYTSHVPLTWGGDQNSVLIEGRPVPGPGERQIVPVRVVTPGYFRAAGTAVLAGRGFGEHDTVDAERVVMVNESFARRFWPGGEAVGRRLQRGNQVVPEAWLRVVGVVADTPQVAVEHGAKAEIYLPYTQWRGYYFVPKDLVVRSAGDPLTLAAAVRRAVHAVDPDQPVTRASRLDAVVAEAFAQRRLQSALFAGFALAALLLSAVGLFGALSQLVARREREFGVRLALGARGADLLRLVLGHALSLVLLGSALGLVGYLWLARFLASLLYQVRPTDPGTIVAVTALLATVGLAACALPAWRAARVDPVAVLRAE